MGRGAGGGRLISKQSLFAFNLKQHILFHFLSMHIHSILEVILYFQGRLESNILSGKYSPNAIGIEIK